MKDNVKSIGGWGRLRIAEEPYEVEHFGRKHHLLPEEARNIVRRTGGSRERADEIAGSRLSPSLGRLISK